MLWHMAGTTPKARAIGVELRRAREDAGLSARQLADKLELSHTTVGRWEKGERAPRPVDVATVLSALGSDNQTREELIELARDSDGSHWVASSLPAQRQQLAALLELERTATNITEISPLLVPGLLQTSDYVRAMMTSADIPGDERETRVAVRVGRRDAITRRNPTQYTALIGEAALWQMIGSADVTAEQLEYVLELTQLNNVDLRVVPFTSGWNPALEGPFLLIESQNGPVVQIENRRSGLFLHEAADVSAYRDATDAVLNSALPFEATSELITDVIEKWRQQQ